MIAPGRVGDPDVQGDASEERLLAAGGVELEAVITRGQRPLEEVADPAVGVGQGLGHPDRRGADVESEERHPDADGGRAKLRVEDVG